MDLPLELPNKLHYLSEAKDSNMLLEMLLSVPPDLITFFEYASEDPAWCVKHPDFMKSAIRWITLKSFDEKLSLDFAHCAADSIRRNISLIRPFLFRNLIFEVEGREIEQSSLLWATTSDYFFNHIRIECREKKTSRISMEGLRYEIFEQIQDYVETGSADHLWLKGEHEILEVFRDASDWDIPGLMAECESLLKRYINPENVIETLLKSHRNRWLHLKLTCMEFINELNLGFDFETENIQTLTVEILNFRRRTLRALEPLNQDITHLHLSGSLADAPEFSEVIRQCPNLQGISFSGSNAFSEKFLEIPDNIQDLDLSKCSWLNGEYLKRFALTYPRVKSLNLSSNYDLTYDDWAALINFKELDILDISRSHQIQNEDFFVIFQTCRQIKKLVMEECTQVGDPMFIEIARAMSNLTDLNISKCNISDIALIDLSTKCQGLVTLNLSRCPNITEKGIIESIRHFPSLRELNISNCRIPSGVLKQIKKLRPSLFERN